MRPLPLRFLPVRCLPILFLPVCGGASLAATGPLPQPPGKPAAKASAKALTEPLWELGLYNFVVSLPHYPGSNESRVYAFPTPFVTYRGERLRATRDGVRGIFYQGPRIETNISLSGNPPVSRDNQARAGMPSLDAIGELGPAVKWFFLGRHPLDQLYLRASVRAAASVGFSGGPQLTYQGLAGGLGAVYYNRSRFRAARVRFHLGAGLNFGDRDYNGYFYGVAPAYATAQRPAYRAAAGYAGAYLSYSMQYDVTPRISLGVYSRWDNIAGAVFADSPLVKQNNNFVVGAALILRLMRSSVQVSSDGFD